MTTPAPTPRKDYVAEAQALVLPDLQGPVMLSHMATLVEQGMELREGTEMLLDGWAAGPWSADSAFLDIWGAVLGEPRASRPDRVYRRAIATQQRIYRSAGSALELVTIAQELTFAAEPPRMFETPGAILLEVQLQPDVDEQDRANIRSDIESAVRAGIRVDPILEVTDLTFRFDDNTRGLDRGLLAASF